MQKAATQPVQFIPFGAITSWQNISIEMNGGYIVVTFWAIETVLNASSQTSGRALLAKRGNRIKGICLRDVSVVVRYVGNGEPP